MDNPELMRGIREVSKLAVTAPWLVVLLLKYKESIPEVWKQLETVMKEVAQGMRRVDLGMHLSVIDSELRKAEDTLITACGPLTL